MKQCPNCGSTDMIKEIGYLGDADYFICNNCGYESSEDEDCCE